MSMAQCVSEMTKGHKDAHDSYHELVQLRRDAIAKIRFISRDIQSLERKIKEGSIVCSKMSIVSGVVSIAGIFAAPFTCGGSLGLTCFASGIGISSGVMDMVQSSVNNSGIQAKSKEALTLLEVIKSRTENFYDQIKNLYELQRKVCIPLKIDHISLHAISFACGKVVFDSLSRNIPYIEISSRTLFTMVQSTEKTTCVAINVNSTRSVVAPMVGKQAASTVAKKMSLCAIGTAATCIVILLDVAKIAKNTEALIQGKHSEFVTRLENVANEMETELKDDKERYEPIVGG